ncbi:hypothetical protein [Streptomyces rubellomurinus]|uniref:Uncharacterized protein n=2 Tax=Streptomyces TaxID=1883 RepID=A0A0F2T8S7_STRR3|nr:hypothetical protein [Streptomyces rubellomurinus]KJS54799.1 hypothetical protein VM98_17120 [Streptomyces rubellomurinus subsp. indigoferus]KJS59598.1 hypothetical protein VM95_26400 [Streptomyces rubellomurinus]
MSVELPFPVSVEIKGVTSAATFAELSHALDAIRTTLARLPLDEDQAGYLADYFSPASAERIAHQLIHTGTVGAIAYLGLDAHPIYLHPAP